MGFFGERDCSTIVRATVRAPQRRKVVLTSFTGFDGGIPRTRCMTNCAAARTVSVWSEQVGKSCVRRISLRAAAQRHNQEKQHRCSYADESRSSASPLED